MNAKYSKVTQLAGGIALGLIIYTVVSKAIKRKNGSKGLLNSMNINASGDNWVACPNPFYDCEGDCVSNYGQNAWDGDMGSTGSCNTGGAIWNPASRSERGFGGKFF